MELARELIGTPRHLSQHPGGFVLTHDRLDELVRIEPAAMKDRQVNEWDKDELVGLAWREARACDGDAHGLFLEQRHAQRSCRAFSPALAWDRPPPPCPRAVGDKDAPCHRGSGPGRTIATSMTRS
jgi:hypothetical protein